MWISSLPTELIKAVGTHTPAFTVPVTETLSVPIEETVRAFNFVIDKGWVRISPGVRPELVLINVIKAFYWATSEWSAVEIEEAHREPDGR